MTVKAYSMTFDGALLARGFWLYVWRVTHPGGSVLYVGRTGDSSSPNASSPFRRIGQHLDTRANAKGNALGRSLTQAGIDPAVCSFEMIAIGPLFAEQSEVGRHVVLRDKVAALERALADHLRERRYEILGAHPAPKPFDNALFDRVRDVIDGQFPIVGGARAAELPREG